MLIKLDKRYGAPMQNPEILIIKTAALGDVLRTTSILPGLTNRYLGARITWIVGPRAGPLVRHHSLIQGVIAVDSRSPEQLLISANRLRSVCWTRVLSLDEEFELCELVSCLAGSGVLSGASVDSAGRRMYTEDVRPWFDMSLISRFGKTEADRLKLANRRTHPEIIAEMLGIPMGAPDLFLPDSSRQFAKVFIRQHGLRRRGHVIGLNTGAGGRWESKKLPVPTVCALMEQIHDERLGTVVFIVLGGPEERDRNEAIIRTARDDLNVIDAGVDNSLLDFAAIVSELDLLVSSDSLAMHIAIARKVPVVAFFAPTSAAEINFYGRGDAVRSLAPDYCSYLPGADTSTLTPDRLAAAVLPLLTDRCIGEAM